jgi:hypothetical protein
MARRRKDNYYSAAQDSTNRKFNLAVGMMEKTGFEDRFEDQWEVAMPKDVEEAGSQMIAAPTTNPSRPRAFSIGYNPTTKKLVIIFRDNTWWEYRDVPSEIWMGLKSAKSTGRFLIDSGLNNWSDMGPSDPAEMSESGRTRLSETATIASKMQKGNSSI